MTDGTVKTRKPGDESFRPVLYSMLVLPGLGQWKQRRYNAGTFYMAGFLILALMLAVILFDQMRAGAGWDKGLFKPLGAVLFVYVANVIDVLRGRLQLSKRASSLD